jgi:hypothetical protein
MIPELGGGALEKIRATNTYGYDKPESPLYSPPLSDHPPTSPAESARLCLYFVPSI